MMKRFYENDKGVHLGCAHESRTLCGDVLEGDIDEYSIYNIGIQPANDTKCRVVTCPDCIRVILHCRDVRIK